NPPTRHATNDLLSARSCLPVYQLPPYAPELMCELRLRAGSRDVHAQPDRGDRRRKLIPADGSALVLAARDAGKGSGPGISPVPMPGFLRAGRARPEGDPGHTNLQEAPKEAGMSSTGAPSNRAGTDAAAGQARFHPQVHPLPDPAA